MAFTGGRFVEVPIDHTDCTVLEEQERLWSSDPAMHTTKISIAVVPVDQEDAVVCHRSRLLVARVLGKRVDLVCRGLFDICFAYLGVARSQYTVSTSAEDRTETHVLVESTVRCEHDGPGGAFWRGVPGFGNINMYFSCDPFRFEHVEQQTAAQASPVVDLGQGLGVSPVRGGKSELLSLLYEFPPPRLSVVIQAKLVRFLPAAIPRSAGVWNEDQVHHAAGRAWVAVGSFDEHSPVIHFEPDNAFPLTSREPI